MHVKPNLPFGTHKLNLVHVQSAGTRVSFVFAAEGAQFNEVIRTFTLGTGQLASFLEGFYRAKKHPWTIEDCKALIGKTVEGEIGPARNPLYVNLVNISRVHSAGGGSFIFNTQNPVNGLETGTSSGDLNVSKVDKSKALEVASAQGERETKVVKSSKRGRTKDAG